MKAIVDPAILGKELKRISPVIAKNQVMPILGCVLLNFSEGQLVVTGTNLNSWISHTMACECDKKFSLAIDINDLTEICDKSAGPLTIVSEEKQTKFIREKGSSKLPIYADPKDFPSVEEVVYDLNIEVDGEFYYALHGAASCSSRDDLRPQLNGVGLDFKKDSVSVVGLDGFILRQQDFKVKNKKQMIVTVNRVFCELVKSFQQSTFSLSEKFAKAEFGGTTVVSRLGVTRYVDYTVLLQAYTGEFNYKIERKDLLTALSKLSVAADKSTNQVSLIFKKEGLQLYSIDNLTSKESDELVVNIGDPLKHDDVLLNTKFLSTLLNTITEDIILLHFQDNPKTPIYIQPEGDETVRLMVAPLIFN